MKMNKYYFTTALASFLVMASCGDDDSNNVGTGEEFSAEVSISASSTSASEGGSAIVLTVSLDQQNTSGGTLTVPLVLTGTATESNDFQLSSSSATIAENQTSATVQVNIVDDSDDDDDETVIVTLGSLPSSLTAGSSNSVTITIIDNDDAQAPTVTVNLGATTGTSMVVNDWTDVGADRYIFVISTSNSFSEFTSSSGGAASTAYIGYGEQIVYNSSSIGGFEVNLLASGVEYFLKVIPTTAGEYDNSQTPVSSTVAACVTTSTTDGQVCFAYGSDTRTISSNQLANHTVGNFPNADPTAIEVTRVLDLSPSYTGTAIYVYDETGPPTPSNQNFWQFGMATNGVEFHPMGLKPWTNPNSGEENWEWQAKVTEEDDTDLDAYGAHVTSAGNYHYHGDIVGLADEEDGSRHSLIYGFAADGFPIYYKYGYVDASDPTSGIMELESSYQLKSGNRSGTGIAGEDYPDGTHDGTYIQDFEYVQSLGDLDECNGRTGVTPEFPGGTYYYVITSEFPVVPNCFFGTPDDDWIIGN